MVQRAIDLYRRAYGGLSLSAWLLSLAIFVNRCGTMVLPFMMIYLTDRCGFTKVDAADVVAGYGLGAIAGAWLGGRLTDRFGPKRVQVVSITANGIGFLILGQITGHDPLVVAMIVLGLISEAVRPANAAAMAAVTDASDRSRAFALNRLAVNLGMSIGPVAGGLLLAHGSPQWLFIVDGGTSLLAAVVVAVGLPPMPALPRRAPGSTERHRFGAFGDLRFVAVCGVSLLVGSVFFQLFTNYPVYLHLVRHLDEDIIGWVLAINTVIIVCFEMIIVHALEGRRPLRLAAVAALLLCLGFALTPVAPNLLALAGTIVLWTAGEILLMSPLASFVSRRAPPGMTGAYMAMYTISYSIANIVAPKAGAMIWERRGPEAVWYACGIAGLVACGAFLLIDRSLERGASPPAA